MASGNVTVFSSFKVDVLEKVHNLETDTFKLGLITSAVTPTETTAAPHWGGSGTTNFATNQVTPGGNYSTGGPTIANPEATAVSANAKFDGDDVTISQSGSNPTDARWGIIYNDTDSSKRAVAFLDLGSVRDLTQGDFTVTWHANGIFTLS